MNKKNKFRLEKRYDGENKNRIRNLIVDKVREYNINSILTLESPDFLFSKLLPDKKIIVFEDDGDVMVELEKNCPKNVELIFGNINKFGIFDSKVDMIYLDFCRTWMTEQENIIKLKDSLKQTKLFILSICLRESSYHKKTGNTWNGDYQFDLLKRLQEVIGINWKIVYGESYYDSMQMVVIILENKEVNENGH